MTAPPIQYSGPHVSAEVPWETRVHLQALYQKLGNHTQAFSLLSQKTGVSTTTINNVIGGGSGGGGSTPGSGVGVPINNQSGATSYSTTSGDDGVLIVFSNAAPIAVSIVPQAPPYSFFAANQGALGAGTVTLTPSTGTINGAASLAILPTYCALVAFDGTNWIAATLPIVAVTFTAVAHQFLTAYNAATGAFTAAQPSFTDISGVAAAAQLPNPTTSTLGGVEAISPVSHQWVNQIDTSGVPHLSQPAFSDISGTPSTAQVPVQSLTTTGSGAATLVAGVMNIPTPVAPFSGNTASMGGSPMTVGQTITATATVTGATTAMVASCSPQTYPGAGFVWDAYVSGANTVTARLTCILVGTPTASIYSCRVIQ